MQESIFLKGKSLFYQALTNRNVLFASSNEESKEHEPGYLEVEVFAPGAT